MDASAAPVDANGEGSATGQFSRYTNMNVPTLNLTGWWDIFIDGQIDTWTQMKKYTLPQVKDKQYIVIGPWAHQTIGQTKTGDMQYKSNVTDILDVNIDGIDMNNIPETVAEAAPHGAAAALNLEKIVSAALPSGSPPWKCK